MSGLGLFLATSLATAAPVRHAIVVGANEGGGILEDLRYAENDAEQVANVLVELGDFDETLVDVLYHPTQEELRLKLAEHAAISEAHPDDLFLFYYSGHADAQGLRLNEERYFFETLKHDFRAVEAEVRIGVLDACRSGTITRLKGAAIADTMFGGEGNAVAGEAWLTASSADEMAQESDALRGGFFTHYMISGLRGAADLDDGVVDLEELKRYTSERVVANTGATTGGTQHPHFDYNLHGSGDIGLTSMRNASTHIILPDEVEGHISVLKLPERVQIVELSKLGGHALDLALPSGRYLAQRRQGEDHYEVGFSVNDGATFEIRDWGHPVSTYGRLRGDDLARTNNLADISEAFEIERNLRKSPVVAGGASLVIPGAGQVYNGQLWKGAAYLGITYGLLLQPLMDPNGTVDPNLSTLFGAAMWGASIADAIYNVHQREDRRPVGGMQLSWGGSFGGNDWIWTRHIGLSADVMLIKGQGGQPSLSIGADRIGYSAYESGFDLNLGSRVMVGWEGRSWRPAAILAVGVRHGRVPLPDQTARMTRSVVGAGGNIRYYFVPRYFTEIEARWERDGEQSGLRSGIALGVHFGR